MIEVLVLVGYLAVTIGLLGVVLSRSFARSSFLSFSDNGIFEDSKAGQDKQSSEHVVS